MVSALRRLGRAVLKTGQSAMARRRSAPLHSLGADIEHMLADLARGRAPLAEGPVLVDGMWDNPNYWLRLSLVRAALGTRATSETGIVGRWNRRDCVESLERLGIQVLDGTFADDPAASLPAARALLAATRSAQDVLHWQLPGGFPAPVFYDAMQKRQRAAAVDLSDPLSPDIVAEGLAAIASGGQVLDRVKPSLVLLSHAINFDYAALAWAALSRNIPVLVLFGNYGTARFARLDRPAHMFDTVDRPSHDDIGRLSPPATAALATRGRAYMSRRLSGQTEDLGAKYAFGLRADGIDRARMAAQFGWDPAKPVVAFYASNWFDFPHACGMTQFRDFLDWLEATLAVARKNTAVNWLFKPHPCDDWYGGVTLRELMSGATAPHMRMVDTAWNNTAVIDSVDAIITYHGTVGIEAASAGKPVLVADRGWYDDCGFVVRPADRAAYLDALGREWWRDVDIEQARRHADIFAGWYFEPPPWQGRFVTGDDSEQLALYPRQLEMLTRERDVMEREIETIGRWFVSGERFYQTYKVRTWLESGAP